MKKIVSFLSISFLLFACSGNDGIEVGNKTEMEVEKVVDMGEVMYGENVNAKFTIKNTGKYPLILADVKGSCSCTVAEWPKDPIAPGVTKEIKATIKTAGSSAGTLKKDVRITANTIPSVTSVIIKANVVQK